MGKNDKDKSSTKQRDQIIPRADRDALIEAAASQAANSARKRMSAILATKEVGYQRLRRSDIKVQVNVPSLGSAGSLAANGGIIGDARGDNDVFWIIDDDPGDTVIRSGGDGPIWWADMTDDADPQ